MVFSFKEAPEGRNTFGVSTPPSEKPYEAPSASNSAWMGCLDVGTCARPPKRFSKSYATLLLCEYVSATLSCTYPSVTQLPYRNGSQYVVISQGCSPSRMMPPRYSESGMAWAM